MAKQKKFGAFAGVFTPSVLTILGVIMYMRLGWVVGSAGLITALIIIVISHVISLTTGLSISSVATDKKIKTGGIYYMLSRSLGFPMGGAIGIALFVGTALGISLYLIGFAESLLSVDVIRETLHLKQDINSYRIIGSAALLLLVTIAFISTSLAIKSQYFILGVIALSLVSIVIGFITNIQLAPETILLTPSREGVDIQVIFGVFFPAVTGFTAGVAMSGDLKNPKKNIPFGTLSAIIVGFIIYVGLAIAFAFFVNRDLLLNDYNFLLKIAWYPPIVLAGIWGATLSSALGGILGGPRILQAISKDKITPKIFAKGYGASNEPRNALIFIFLIAEAGILIGELNVIAGVVSMFYLASYGFINLAFFLENWASTDFRPTFKVKGIVGLIGFIASFAVMAQLGMLSMIASFVIMFGLFAWLNRKQLKSESGDVWQSVWLSVVRRALHSLDKKTLEDRNWQPNIILFSGGKGQRPHLMKLGKDLVGQYGLLSNFDLHESDNKKYLFPKHLQSHIEGETEGKGIFTRRQTCSDIYTGIETIVSTYGFSGIEPNTVILGWMRQSKEPIRFSQMINRISELDVNILLVDYDKRVGFGNYKTIDIWWRGAGNNGNLALNLYKFLQASENWADAKLRLLVGNPVNEEASILRKHAEQVLSNMRINAEIKILNNQIEQKPFYELIRTESLKTDLIILGMPFIKEGNETEFVEQTSSLMQDIGTVVLIKASSQFKNHHLLHENEINFDIVDKEDINSDINEKKHNLIIPNNAIAEEKILTLKNKLDLINNSVINKGIKIHFEKYSVILNSVFYEFEVLVNEKLKNISDDNILLHENKLMIATDLFLKKTLSFIKVFSKDNEHNIHEEIIEKLFGETDTIVSKLPDLFYQSFDVENKKQKTYKVKYKKLVQKYLPYEYYNSFFYVGKKVGINNIQIIIELHSFVKLVRNSLLKFQATIRNNTFSKELINDEINNLLSLKNELQTLYNENITSILNLSEKNTILSLNKISNDLNLYSSKSNLKRIYSQKVETSIKEKIEEIPNYFYRNEELIINYWSLSLQLMDFENKIYRITRKSTLTVEKFIEDEVLIKITKIKKQLNSFIVRLKKDKNAEFEGEEFSEIPSSEVIFNKFKEILDTKHEKLKYLSESFPDKIQLLTNEAYNNFSENQFSQLETIDISASGLINYILQSDFNTPLINLVEQLPEEIIRIENAAQNILRIIIFSFFDSEGKIMNKEENTPKVIIKFISEKIDVLNELEDEAKHKIQYINRNINERLSEISNKLTVYSLINHEDSIKKFSKKHLNVKKTNKIFDSLKTTKSKLSKQINYIRYKQSDTILIKKNFIKRAEKNTSKINSSLNLLEQVSVKNNILHKLPFFYQQLFLRTNNYNKNFFIGRTNELSEIEKSINRQKAGYQGAILIRGEQYSGKTFLSQYAANKFLPNSKIYTISPPTEGSTNIKTFKTKLAIAFDANGSYVRKFTKIQNGSVIIFDEMELWWEKSENGFDVINEIIELIETYSNKFLFILNINSNAYKIISLITNIDNYLLNIIDCKPFNAIQIKDAILFRHNSGGIPFMYKNKMQDNLKPAEYAKLFTKYFNYSGGNIGVALFSWVSNVVDFKENVLYLKGANNVNSEIFDEFDQDIYILLLQFILHKRLTVSKLSRIMLNEENIIEKQIAFLKRSGLLIEEGKGIFEINKFLFVHIIHKLEDIGMI